MGYPELIYKVIQFFFNDFYHFLMLAILIYLTKTKRLQLWPSNLFSKFMRKYREWVSRYEARPKPPAFLDRDETKIKHPEGEDSWRQQ